jgi:hypothetical protein
MKLSDNTYASRNCSLSKNVIYVILNLICIYMRVENALDSTHDIIFFASRSLLFLTLIKHGLVNELTGLRPFDAKVNRLPNSIMS